MSKFVTKDELHSYHFATKKDVADVEVSLRTEIEELGQSLRKEMKEMEARLISTREKDKTEFNKRFDSLDSKLDKLINTVDGLAGMIMDDRTENTARDAQLGRHDR